MVKKVYDQIASSYDRDIFATYERTRKVVQKQISANLHAPIACALDFAVGTGMALLSLIRAGVQIRHMIGNDISDGMLAIAQHKLGNRLETISDDLANIHEHVKDNAVDLVLCHFIFSYCDLGATLDSAYRVIQPGGFISVATTTKRNYLDLRTGRFERAAEVMGANATVARAFIPEDHGELCAHLRDRGFTIIQEDRLRDQVTFRSFRDVEVWGLESGWAASFYEGNPYFKKWLARTMFFIASLIMRPLYPIETTEDISVILARKGS
jgi:ubiquinone/menaquinone biosynthesis C-methylase UbiE